MNASFFEAHFEGHTMFEATFSHNCTYDVVISAACGGHISAVCRDHRWAADLNIVCDYRADQGIICIQHRVRTSVQSQFNERMPPYACWCRQF